MEMKTCTSVIIAAVLLLTSEPFLSVATAEEAEGIEVEKLPSVFDDGTHIPDHIELKTWDQTDEIIPKGTIFDVVDIETGLFFQVQRRAGSNHADVQPLTKTDTAIMKAIYNGKWSWKRRAIYIMKDGHIIAASMHGMPHGAGALANNFPGHFCIHLPGSTTHRSRKEDPTHQLMILKAAEKLDRYLEYATSDQLAEVFMLAVNQEDHSILRKTFRTIGIRDEELEKLFFIHPLKPRPKHEPDSMLITEIPVKVVYRSDRGLQKQKLDLRLKRNSLLSRWYVDIRSVLENLPGDDEAQRNKTERDEDRTDDRGE